MGVILQVDAWHGVGVGYDLLVTNCPTLTSEPLRHQSSSVNRIYPLSRSTNFCRLTSAFFKVFMTRNFS